MTGRRHVPETTKAAEFKSTYRPGRCRCGRQVGSTKRKNPVVETTCPRVSPTLISSPEAVMPARASAASIHSCRDRRRRLTHRRTHIIRLRNASTSTVQRHEKARTCSACEGWFARHKGNEPATDPGPPSVPNDRQPRRNRQRTGAMHRTATLESSSREARKCRGRPYRQSAVHACVVPPLAPRIGAQGWAAPATG